MHIHMYMYMYGHCKIDTFLKKYKKVLLFRKLTVHVRVHCTYEVLKYSRFKKTELRKWKILYFCVSGLNLPMLHGSGL